MIRLTQGEAKKYIPLEEDYTGKTFIDCPYFTLTPEKDGWEKVTHYTGRLKNVYTYNEGVGKQWVYVFSNPSFPDLVKIGYTKAPPNERAKQLSRATGVALDYQVEYVFRCHDGESLEKEVHNCLDAYRVNPKREFFKIPIGEAVRVINEIGKNYN